MITGPTASGKSALAVSLAHKLKTEIISADSRQIFKGIPIVTAVPNEEEKEGIFHHLMEILPLDAYYSAASFRDDALKLLGEITEKYGTAIICGGSMLYIDALTNGIDNLPTVPQEIRLSLMKQWETNGDQWIIEQLKTFDPDYFSKADLKNLKRVFHAVEVSITAGQPYSSLLTGSNRNFQSDQPFDFLKICLSGNRETLFQRINIRVEKMIQSGLEQEAQSVYDLRHLNSLNTVGLKEMFAFLDGIFTRQEAIARIQKNTRVYAKKQITWHKKDENMKFLDFSYSHHYNIDKILSF